MPNNEVISIMRPVYLKLNLSVIQSNCQTPKTNTLPNILLKIFIKEGKNYLRASVWHSAKIVAFHLFDFSARVFIYFGALVLVAITVFCLKFCSKLKF